MSNFSNKSKIDGLELILEIMHSDGNEYSLYSDKNIYITEKNGNLKKLDKKDDEKTIKEIEKYFMPAPIDTDVKFIKE